MENEVITEKKEGTGKIVGAGKVQSFQVNVPLQDQINQNGNQQAAAADTAKTGEDQVGKEGTAAAATQAANQPDNTAASTEDTTNKETALNTLNEPAKLSDEDLKKLYEERFPTHQEPSAEEKQKAADAFDKRLLDLYVETGLKSGKKTDDLIAEYAMLKQFVNADLTELSETTLLAELKVAGITDPEAIKQVKRERYFQIEQAEIDAIEDPEEKALAQKKFDYGKNKLIAKGQYKKDEAVDFFNTLTDAVKSQDALVQKESEFVSNVETHFKEVPRKLTLELGKTDDVLIDPIEYDVPEDAITEARETLKDPLKRKQLLFTDNGQINLKSVAELLLKAKMFDSAAKTAFLTGGDREVEKFKKIFPHNDPNGLGVGGGSQNPQGQKGKIVSAGQPQRFKPAAVQ